MEAIAPADVENVLPRLPNCEKMKLKGPVFVDGEAAEPVVERDLWYRARLRPPASELPATSATERERAGNFRLSFDAVRETRCIGELVDGIWQAEERQRCSEYERLHGPRSYATDASAD